MGKVQGGAPTLVRHLQGPQPGEALADRACVLTAHPEGALCTSWSLANGESDLPTASTSPWL